MEDDLRLMEKMSGTPNWAEKAIKTRRSAESEEIENPLRLKDLEALYTGLFVNQLSAIEKEIKKSVHNGLKTLCNSKNIEINNLRNKRYSLKQPLCVNIEDRKEVIVASNYDTNMYATGANEEEAIDNLCEIIVEYFTILKSESKKLGVLPTKHWEYLKSIIKIK